MESGRGRECCKQLGVDETMQASGAVAGSVVGKGGGEKEMSVRKEPVRGEDQWNNGRAGLFRDSAQSTAREEASSPTEHSSCLPDGSRSARKLTASAALFHVSLARSLRLTDTQAALEHREHL